MNLFPHYAFTKQAEESARKQIRAALGTDREDAAMQIVADLYATTLMPLDAAVRAVIIDLATGERP